MSPSPAEAPIPSAEPAPTPASDARPVVLVEGDTARLLLPFEGALEGMHSMLWGAPYALVITLPEGEVVLADGRHRLSDGGFGDLRVERRAGRQSVRVTLSAPILRYTVVLEGGTLELRVVRARSANR
jgi:hypothetical protein